MLSVYTRHYAPCTHLTSTIGAAATRNGYKERWTAEECSANQPTLATGEKAELTARALEDAANPHRRVRARVTIADAIQCFREMKNLGI